MHRFTTRGAMKGAGDAKKNGIAKLNGEVKPKKKFILYETSIHIHNYRSVASLAHCIRATRNA